MSRTRKKGDRAKHELPTERDLDDEADLSYLLGPRGKLTHIGPEKGRTVRDGIAHFVGQNQTLGGVADTVYVPGGSNRYVLFEAGRPIAALQVVSDGHGYAKIANVYVLPDRRRHGLAAKLLQRARRDFEVVEHSEHLTGAGAAWAKAVNPRQLNVPAPDDLRRRRFYHGTPDAGAAELILRQGQLRPRAKTGKRTSGKGWTEPVADKVYVTSDRDTALEYAFRAHGHDDAYLFEVDGRALVDVQPDEDEVGDLAFILFGHDATGAGSPMTIKIVNDYLGPYWRSRVLGKASEPLPPQLVEMQRKIGSSMTAGQRERIEEGRTSEALRASVGKRVLRKLSDAEKTWLLEQGASVAHAGPLPVVAAWKIQRMKDYWKALGDGFGKYAQPLPLGKEHATARSRARVHAKATKRDQNPKRSAKLWYHGGDSLRTDFRGQRWDRDRTTASLNEEGPGVYFTDKLEQAASYGPYVVVLQLPQSFKVMPRRKPTMAQLRRVYDEADAQSQEVFLSNWGEGVSVDDVLRKYSHQNTLHDALVSLYGDLFLHDAQGWIDAVRSLGYDGVIVPKSYGVKHLIVWAPDEIVGHVHEAGFSENPGARGGTREELLAW